MMFLQTVQYKKCWMLHLGVMQKSCREAGTHSAGKKKENHIIPKEGVLNDNQGVFSGYPWGKLYKYNVMEHFQFPEGFWFEDTPLSFMIAAMPYRCAAIKDIVYGYRFNPQGITATARKKKELLKATGLQRPA